MKFSCPRWKYAAARGASPKHKGRRTTTSAGKWRQGRKLGGGRKKTRTGEKRGARRTESGKRGGEKEEGTWGQKENKAKNRAGPHDSTRRVARPSGDLRAHCNDWCVSDPPRLEHAAAKSGAPFPACLLVELQRRREEHLPAELASDGPRRHCAAPVTPRPANGRGWGAADGQTACTRRSIARADTCDLLPKSR